MASKQTSGTMLVLPSIKPKPTLAKTSTAMASMAPSNHERVNRFHLTEGKFSGLAASSKTLMVTVFHQT